MLFFYPQPEGKPAIAPLELYLLATTTQLIAQCLLLGM